MESGHRKNPSNSIDAVQVPKMMIQVKDLTRSFRRHHALKGISFDIEKGVVGFLGPNGAGKSTTMKILSGCLAASSGSVSIVGYDVLLHPIRTRQAIGYMPETTPLDEDMRVGDYLRFRAGIKGVKSPRIRQRLDLVVEQCELRSVIDRRIGVLSKGFKQRVGLADAMIHDPPILILDEPTSGLDPNQIRSVRELIRQLGTQHTVLLSTHILQEIESTCDRAIILNQGRILLDDTIGSIQKKLGRTNFIRAVIDAPLLEVEKALLHLPHFLNLECSRTSDGFCEARISLRADNELNSVHRIAPQIARIVVENHWDLIELQPQQRNLEDIFTELTHNQTGNNEAHPSAATSN